MADWYKRKNDDEYVSLDISVLTESEKANLVLVEGPRGVEIPDVVLDTIAVKQTAKVGKKLATEITDLD